MNQICSGSPSQNDYPKNKEDAMWIRNLWVVICLCTIISAPTANAKVSQEPQLRKIIPAGTLGYIRTPNLWGFLSDPKGNVS